MSTRTKRSPCLRRYKKTGHANAKFDRRQPWFGQFDDPETHERFARTRAECICSRIGCAMSSSTLTSMSHTVCFGRCTPSR